MDIKRNIVIGSCLRKLREDAGFTQVELAKRMNKSQSFVSKVENAERSLHLSETYLYAEALDCDYNILADVVYGGLSNAGLDQHVDPLDQDEVQSIQDESQLSA